MSRRLLTALAVIAGWASAATVALAAPPAPDARLVGDAREPTPLGLSARVRAHASLLATSDFPLDDAGTRYQLDPTVDTQFRVHADYRHVWGEGRRDVLTLTYEHDLMSGVVAGGPDTPDGVGVPYAGDAVETQLRIASLRVAFGDALSVAVGAMTSHWGLGLVANDGAHGWAPGSARFSDPRGGDRVLRAMVTTGPHTDQGLVVFWALDRVLGDDVLLRGDEAWQVVTGALVGPASGRWQAGVCGVLRTQEASDGDFTRVGVVDVYAKAEATIARLKLRGELEAALVAGTTDLGPTPEHPHHDVLEGGAAVRLTLDACLGGAALDVLYASGDPAWDDDTQSGFKADRNFDLGLLLNDVVLAARTSRTPARASDPALVGVPSEDLERLPTRGAATNTVSFFPRGWVRPVDGVELYGGLLIALTATSESDAFAARVNGGAPRNALGGKPTALLATELDVGARFSGLLGGTRLGLGVEGGVLFPGGGLTGPGDLGGDAIWGGRVLATYEL